MYLGLFFFIKLNKKIHDRRSRLATGTAEDIMLICENAKFDMCSNDDDDYDSDYEDDIYWLFLFSLKF